MILYYTMLYHIISYCIALNCIVLYWIVVLYYIVFCYTERNYTMHTVQYWNVPDRNDFICTDPIISECRTVPFEETKRLSFSTTSKKISFFLCLMPKVQQRKKEKDRREIIENLKYLKILRISLKGRIKAHQFTMVKIMWIYIQFGISQRNRLSRTEFGVVDDVLQF